MGIESPTTYGDYYWASQLESQKLFDENTEQVLAPFFASLLAEIPALNELPYGMRSFIEVLRTPVSAGMGGFALGVGVETIDEVLHTALGPMMSIIQRKMNSSAREKWLTSAEANTLFRHKKIPEEFWETILASEGYEDVLGGAVYKSQMPYPTIPEFIMYSRYHGDTDNVWGTLQEFYNIDPVDFKVWEWLGQQRLTTEQAQTLFKRGLLDDTTFNNELAQLGWSRDDFNYIKDLGYLLPNPMLMVQGSLMAELGDEIIIKNLSVTDIHPDYAQSYFDAVLTKPASIDLIAYHLRQENKLANLNTDLRKIGIHKDYFDVYNTLAYQIPPVADIITMAVREAFTPSIAERFGQYEDFPPEFERYAAMKGLDSEWAKRYWAAHWALPSAQQGFEMLHRGVIGEDELDLLLRAQDVMPFWRDKLTAIAYRPLTRVDVRRMYREGVLDEAEVVSAYLDAGYSEENAERMALFTVRQTLTTLSKFSSGDIVKAFTNRMISRSEAMSLLRKPVLETKMQTI